MDGKTQKDRIRGSLVGGAIGDALGYPIEFISSYSAIQARYSEEGITRLDTNSWGSDATAATKAYISDDTQMTLFTACGILNAKEKGMAPVPSICEAYIEWYYTQIGMRSSRFKDCWIGDIPELNRQRAPGNTCMEAIATILSGRMPQNDSKGCGGVMRISPIPLYGAAQSRITDIEALDKIAADAAKLTHHHPLGYIPAALLSHIIYLLVSDEHPDRNHFKEYIEEGLKRIKEMFTGHTEEVNVLASLIHKAILLADKPISAVTAIENELGGGWVAEETVAIAVYCALAHFDNFENAMTASVNHAGDSDSTGAVTGNILGAAIGYEAIPQYYKDALELHDVIIHIADNLYEGKNTLYSK